MEPGVVQGQPAGHLPADAVGEGPGGVAIGQTLQGLEHHDRGHDVGRDRRTAAARGEQVFEHLVGEQLLAVVRQEGLDTSFGHELTTQRGSVEQLTVGFASSLHDRSLEGELLQSEHPRADYSAVS